MKHTVPAKLSSGEYVIRRGRSWLRHPSWFAVVGAPLCWAAQRFDDLDSVTAAIFQLQELEAALVWRTAIMSSETVTEIRFHSVSRLVD